MANLEDLQAVKVQYTSLRRSVQKARTGHTGGYLLALIHGCKCKVAAQMPAVYFCATAAGRLVSYAHGIDNTGSPHLED